jgi:hypothetical protein
MKIKDLRKILDDCDDEEANIYFYREGECVGLMKEDIQLDPELSEDWPAGLYIGI